jgi:hypothetical protein
MVPDDVRRLALALPGVVAASHVDHRDLRAGGRIFAPLQTSDAPRGVVKLTPEQQGALTRTSPAAFLPMPGASGRGDATFVRLAAAPEAAVREALRSAWRNVPQQKLPGESRESGVSPGRSRSARRGRSRRT